MIIVCPKCNHARELPEDQIPSDATETACPKCGFTFIFRVALEGEPRPMTDEDFDFSKSGPDNVSPAASEGPDPWDKLKQERSQAPPPLPPAAPPDSDQEDDFTEVPWERLDKYGFLSGLLLTAKRALFSPILFFRGAPKSGMLKPLAYAALVSYCSLLIRCALRLFYSESLQQMAAEMFENSTSPAITIISAIIAIIIFLPMAVVVSIFITAAFAQVLLKMCRAASSGFEATFRVAAYAQSAQLLSVIPFFGSFIALPMFIVVSIIGCKEAHQSSYPRVITALVAIPVALFIAAFVLFSSLGRT